MEKNYGKVAKQNIDTKSTSKKISMWALCMMSILMIFSFSNIVYNYVGLGWSAAPAFIAAIVVYLVPFSLVIAEFASLKKAKGSKSGLMKWVEVGIGRKIAFLTAFMFWFANLTYFMGALPGFAVSFGFGISGKDLTETDLFNIMVPIFGVLVFFVITFLSTKSTRSMSKITTVGGTLVLGITFFFFFVAIVAYILMLSSGVQSYGGISEWGFFVVPGKGETFMSQFETTTDGVWIPSFNNYDIPDSYTSLLSFSRLSSDIPMDQWISLSDIPGFASNFPNIGSEMHFKITNNGGDLVFWLDHTYIAPQAPGVVPEGVTPNFFGEAGGFNYVWFTIFVWVLMAADGAQGLGVYVDDVKGGQKTFIKGLIISVMLIGTLYVLGTFLVAVFPGDSLSNSNYLTISLMFYYIFGNLGLDKETSFIITNVFLGWLFFVTGIGAVLMWTAAPVRTLFSESDTGVFGSYITKKNQHGVPYRGAWLQFIIVVPLFTIPFVGLNGINQFIDMIKTAGGSLGMIPPIMIFAAYFNLRLKHDDEERTFRCGSRNFGLIMGAFILVIYSWVFLMAFFPYDPAPDSNWWVGTVLNVAAIIFVFIPVLFWYLSYEKKQRNIRIAIRNNLDPALIQIYYSKNKFLFAEKETKIRKQLDLDIHLLQQKYNNLYDQTIALDLDLKAKKAKLSTLDKEYKKEYKVLMNVFKESQKEIRVYWKEQGKLEFDKLRPFIIHYKNNIKEIKKEVNAIYKEKFALAIKNYKDLAPETTKKMKVEFKKQLEFLKEEHTKQLEEVIAKMHQKIEAIEIEFESKTASIDSKDTILEFKALKDTDIALEKFYLTHAKTALRVIQKEEILKLKAKYLGEKYLIMLQKEQQLKVAVKDSEKTYIDNFYIEPNTVYSTQDYEPSYEATSFGAIRQYSVMFTPKRITDEVIIDGNQFIVKYLETDKLVTDVYQINDINLYLDKNEKTIHPISKGVQKDLMLINLVNNDKFLTLHEEFFVENYHDLLSSFKKVKELN